MREFGDFFGKRKVLCIGCPSKIITISCLNRLAMRVRGFFVCKQVAVVRNTEVAAKQGAPL